ncbi:MAG: hypothetical protein FWD23_16945, partial [Oscillospiraceae bacterium]|nr:hypothetical protein [Oscillospiraceae bacterium]
AEIEIEIDGDENGTEDSIDVTEPESEPADNIPGSSQTQDAADPAAIPAITVTTEAPTTAEVPDTTEPADAPESADFATVIDVRKVFPDAPEKFTGVPFPESVRMTDSLKKNIKSLADFSAKDFAGMYFYIMTTTDNAALFKPNYSGAMLSDARRYRTNLVDAECGTLIMPIERPREAILQDIRLNLQSDEFVSDIVCAPFDIQSELVRQGLVMNLKKIPFLNPNAEYYNSSATDAFTINGNIYGLVSDLTFDPSNIYAVFFNKSLIEEYNLSNPVEMYYNGAWNYDKMFEISKELTSAISDLDHDLRWSLGIDKENADIINGIFMSSGSRYFTKREYSYPVLSFNSEKTQRLIETVSKIFAPRSESGMENYLTSDEWNQNKAFSNGNVLFSVLKLDIIPEISDSPFDWGILPVPALGSNGYENENGRPYSFTDNSALSISVLKSTRNTEACGIVASALSLASHRELKEIYVREQMTYHLRNVDSVKILGDIVHNITFSQYNAFSTIPEVYGSTAGVLKESVNKRGSFNELYENNRKILNDFFKTSRIFDRN